MTIWKTSLKSREELERLASFPQLNPNPVIEVDYSGKITFFNPATEKVLENLGMDKGDVSLFLPADLNVILKDLEKETESSLYREVMIKDALFEEAVYLSPALRVARIYAHDITGRKQGEEALRKSEERLRLAQDAARAGMWEWNLQTNENIWSEELWQLYGLTPHSVGPSYEAWRNTIHPDDLPEAERVVRESADRGLEFESEWRVRLDSTEERWLMSRGRPVRDSDGKVVRYIGIVIDITERKRAEKELIRLNAELESRVIGRTAALRREIEERLMTEQKLRENEEQFRSMFEKHHAVMLLIDPESGRILDANKAAERFYGYSISELRAMNITEINSLPPEEITRRIQDVLLGDGGFFVFPHRLANGEIRVVEVRSSPFTSRGKQILFSIIHDITERKLAEESLQESEQLLKSVLELLPVGVWITDESGKIISGNSAGQRIWAGARYVGIEQFGEYKGWWLESRKPIGPHEWAAARAIEKGETSIEEEIEIECFDGTHKIILNSALPILRHDGSIGGAIIVNQDITDRHLLQEERLKTQKLEAIGTLAGGIAHDFNNLLQGVFGYISLAKLTVDEPRRGLAMLEQAEKALDMAASLTAQLLTFSKGGKPLKKRIALRSVIEYSASFALSGSRSNFRIAIEENLRQVEADEGQIGQVIRNIVMNASEAMPDGGTVEISADNVDIPEGGHPSVSGGGKFVRIAVRDSGRGISKQDLPKIFDPYFSTKQKGSGLGLATSYSIIRNHGGMIEATSESGKGSTFFIYLPASEAEEKEEKPRAHAPAIRRRGRILLMDDEQLIRNVAKELIETLGHEAECAVNGEDAVEKFRHAMQSGTPFDVVILDLTIKGGMGGEQTIKRLLEIDPDVKAIVSSGYAENPVMSAYRSYGFKACMSKPYTMEALDDNLRAVMG